LERKGKTGIGKKRLGVWKLKTKERENGRKSLGEVFSMRRDGIEEVSKSRRLVFFSVTQNVMG
jgi:hypothetical protein